MRISDWSSDVCSSDLNVIRKGRQHGSTLQHPPVGRLRLRPEDAEDHPLDAVVAGEEVAHRGNGNGGGLFQRKAVNPGGDGRKGDGARAELRGDLQRGAVAGGGQRRPVPAAAVRPEEEHTSELQSLMRLSYAVFCL